MSTRRIASGLAVVLVTMSAASFGQPPENRDGVADTPGTGRFTPLKEIDPRLPDQVVYRPADLGKTEAPPRPADTSIENYAPTRPAQLKAAIDWALAENKRSGSRYFGRIDPNQVAISGFSCGGIQALALAADPRVKTVVIMNSGL